MQQKTKLISKREVAEGTFEFTFERPLDFDYQAGQTIDLTILESLPQDSGGSSRTFSLTSAPHEPVLKIATRMRDTSFKNALGAAEAGFELGLEGPFGSFMLHENTARPAVFLAGGIGVTPFHAILTDAAERALPHKIVLFYSNRRPEDAAFLDELRTAARSNPNILFIPTMTGMEKSKEAWEEETGYIDAALLKRHVPENSMPIYYLAGPPEMITAMRRMLNTSGVSNDDIRSKNLPDIKKCLKATGTEVFR